MDWRTTTAILEDLSAAEAEAWQRLFSNFHGPLVGLCSRAGLTLPEAEDVAQEALLVLLDAVRGGRFDRDRGRLHRWLFGIAKRLVQAQLRRRRRDGERFPEAGAHLLETVPEETAGDPLHQVWADALLERCLQRAAEQVAPRTMEIFERLVLHGETPADVADELGITRNAVFLAKHRVLGRLREARQEQLEL
ncbi:MAG: sigma-70 family RNA polymerase sigma factor [Planctomycetota bacterium]